MGYDDHNDHDDDLKHQLDDEHQHIDHDHDDLTGPHGGTMELIQLVVILIVIGVLLWLVNTYGGQFIDANILKIINAVVLIAVVLWLLLWLLAVAGVSPHMRVGP